MSVADMSGRLCAALLVGLALLPGPASASPGLKETVEWITDKLIKNGGRQRVGDYKGDIYYAETVKAFGDHCRLIVTTTFLMDGDNVRTTFTVPMRDLKRVTRKPFTDGSFDNHMLHIYTNKQTIGMDQTDLSGRAQQWTDVMFMAFSFDKEPEIFDRMQMALKNFSRLANENPKCRSKEVF